MTHISKLTFILICASIVVQASAQTKPAEPEMAPAGFGGRAIDDETGKAVKDFVTQWGAVDKDGVMKWGFSESSSSNRRGGAFSESMHWSTGTRVSLRIIADGYLTTPVVDEPRETPVQLSGLVVRLKHGLTLHGKVVDHDGKPVDQAKVFLAGAQPLSIENDEAQNFKGTIATTDVSGEFDLAGFDPNGDQRVVVVVAGISEIASPGADQASGKPLVVQLPEPAHLRVRYAIANDSDQATVRVELKTWEMPEWSHTTVVQTVKIAQKEEAAIDLAPGVYDFARTKDVRLGDVGHGVFLDRRHVTLKAGETQTIELVRPHGRSLSGEVIGMADAGVTHAMITIRDAKASGEFMARDEWKLPQFDALAVPQENPHFQTAALEPGTYTLIVEAWRPEPRTGTFTTGIRLPAFNAIRKITIPPDKDPAQVKVELKAYERKAPK